MTAPGVRSLHRRLLRWYRLGRRRLPWREKVTPYRTWISEIMLQQTTVAAATPFFERFLARFPDVASLARAGEGTVLRSWAGLGYYSRARNLRRAARDILEKHGGQFPSDFDSVLALPGIGRYTAGAILSIAFQKPYPVLDGNVARVLSRLFALRGSVKNPKMLKRLWGLASELMSNEAPGDWNQALMELGATVCVPAAPRCGDCPLRGNCRAFARGLQHRLPVMAARPKPVDLRWTCLWIERGGRVLLWKRSEDERFLKGHWGLPEKRQVPAEAGALLKTARHSITHHRITVEVRRSRLILTPPDAARWVPRDEIEDRLVSSLWRKCLP